ncbi:MAG: hypothetical protein QOI12_397 [Alphaproteobacteria bacterium]|nr:hypothetical protein [Alphaproteobacteria bacterium]
MAQSRLKASPGATSNGARAANGVRAARSIEPRGGPVPAKGCSHAKRTNGSSWSELFSKMACETSRLAGKPLTFLVALLAVLIWAATGPLFGFSDTWQLVINTSTTIVTFLMVFLIQHTQNRDTMALQLKLAELIISVQGAENRLATAEDMTEEDLEQLHEVYKNRAEQTLEHLHHRRDRTQKHAS